MLKGKSSLDVKGGTPHIELIDNWPDILNGVGPPHIILRKSLAVGWGGWGGVVGVGRVV